jgi:hypothetical protein
VSSAVRTRSKAIRRSRLDARAGMGHSRITRSNCNSCGPSLAEGFEVSPLEARRTCTELSEYREMCPVGRKTRPPAPKRAAQGLSKAFTAAATADCDLLGTTPAPTASRCGIRARRTYTDFRRIIWARRLIPFNKFEPVDGSAATIAAQGLIRLGNYLTANGDREERLALSPGRLDGGGHGFSPSRTSAQA